MRTSRVAPWLLVLSACTPEPVLLSLDVPEGARTLVFSTGREAGGTANYEVHAFDLSRPNALSDTRLGYLPAWEGEDRVRYTAVFHEYDLDTLRLIDIGDEPPTPWPADVRTMPFATIPALDEGTIFEAFVEGESSEDWVQTSSIAGRLAQQPVLRRTDCWTLRSAGELDFGVPGWPAMAFEIPGGAIVGLLLAHATLNTPELIAMYHIDEALTIRQILDPGHTFQTGLLGQDGHLWFVGTPRNVWRASGVEVLTATTARLTGVTEVRTSTDSVEPPFATCEVDRFNFEPPDPPYDRRRIRGMAGRFENGEIRELLTLSRDGALEVFDGSTFSCPVRVNHKDGGLWSTVSRLGPNHVVVASASETELVEYIDGRLEYSNPADGRNPAGARVSPVFGLFTTYKGTIALRDSLGDWKGLVLGEDAERLYPLLDVVDPFTSEPGMLIAGFEGRATQHWRRDESPACPMQTLGRGTEIRFAARVGEKVLYFPLRARGDRSVVLVYAIERD